MMSVAQSMLAIGIAEIRLPMIVAEDALEQRQDANRVGGFTTAAVVHLVVGPLAIGGDMQPMAFAVDVDPRLINMQKRGAHERRMGQNCETFQPLEGLLIEVEQRSGTERDLKLFPEVILDALLGNELKL